MLGATVREINELGEILSQKQLNSYICSLKTLAVDDDILFNTVERI
jgi:hypothetical protein